MFPVSLELNASDAALLEELRPALQPLGFVVEPFGKNSFVIQGAPSDVESGEEKGIIESLLEEYKHFNPDLNFSLREKLIRSLAKQRAIRSNTRLTEREMRQLVTDLLQCQQPNCTPAGTPTYLEFKQEELQKLFGK
jgi:DNA mismatch repair protein MutL